VINLRSLCVTTLIVVTHLAPSLDVEPNFHSEFQADSIATMSLSSDNGIMYSYQPRRRIGGPNRSGGTGGR
jgi:hypothetical protein